MPRPISSRAQPLQVAGVEKRERGDGDVGKGPLAAESGRHLGPSGTSGTAGEDTDVGAYVHCAVRKRGTGIHNHGVCGRVRQVASEIAPRDSGVGGLPHVGNVETHDGYERGFSERVRGIERDAGDGESLRIDGAGAVNPSGGTAVGIGGDPEVPALRDGGNLRAIAIGSGVEGLRVTAGICEAAGSDGTNQINFASGAGAGAASFEIGAQHGVAAADGNAAPDAAGADEELAGFWGSRRNGR